MINIFINKIKSHRLAVVVSIIFTLAIIFPRLASQFVISSDFKGIYPSFIEDELHYASRIKEITNGYLLLGNPYIKEHRDDIFIQPPLSEWIIALPVYLTGLSVPLIILLSNFFIIPIFFLLSYFFIYLINKNKIQSTILTSFFFLIFYQTFGRPISPQLNFIFLLCGLILIFDIYDNKSLIFSIKTNNILYGVFTGICLFISPYYFTTLVVVYGLVFVFKLFVNGVKPVFFDSIWFMIPLLPFVALYGFFLVRASRVLAYADVSTRFGMISSHWPGSYTNIFLGILSVLVLYVARKLINKDDWYLGLIFALSIFVLNWQNVITGQALQFPSHYLVVTILFVITSVGYALGSLNISTFSYRDKKAMGILLAVFLVIVVLTIRQKREFSVLVPKVPNKQFLVDLQKDKTVFDWLNKNTEKNSVVYVLGDELNEKITLYTNNKVFYERYGALYLVSDNEVIDRWLIQNYFVPTIDREYVLNNQKDIWWNRYVDSYFFNQNKDRILSIFYKKHYSVEEMIPEDILEDVVRKGGEISKQNPKVVFQMYEVDYILLSKDYKYYSEASKKIAKIPNFHKVISLDMVDIYKVD